MRPQSSVQFSIQGRLVGGPRPLVCVPLMAATRDALLAQARVVDGLAPDLLEWRVDALATLSDLAAVRETLFALSAGRRSTPLLFTCRAAQEGGLQVVAPDLRRRLYEMAIASERVDLIDVELASGPETIGALGSLARSAGVKMVLSYHNFESTPAGDVLLQKLLDAERAGADVAKIAVMPDSGQDVLTVLDVTWTARRGFLKIPLIAIAMGPQGVLTRIAGGLFGADITFASGGQATAPGQLSIEALRKAWSALSWQKDPLS